VTHTHTHTHTHIARKVLKQPTPQQLHLFLSVVLYKILKTYVFIHFITFAF